MKTKMLLFTAIAILTCIVSTQAQIVNIPDANFKAALVGNASINTNMDAEIQVSEAAAYTGAIHVSQLGITDLTGIEAFVLLDSLDCSNNQIAGLDVSANIGLTYLDCSGAIGGWFGPSNLSSINVTGLNNLTYLDCGANILVSLDVSTNTSLYYLDCSSACVDVGIGGFYGALTNLNLSGAIALTYLDCSLDDTGFPPGPGSVAQSSFGYLDVSTNTALTYINCSGNVLTSLDLSANTALTYLDVSANTALTTLQFWGNQLTSLNVSFCTALFYLNCMGNQLTSLDVSACTALSTLYCSDNQLTNLNVKNGNNINMFNFYALGNPNLSCIEVDSAAWSNINWPYIDPTASFSENCSGAGISDINESNAPMFYPNPTTGTIYLSEQSNISLIDLSGKLLLEEKNTNQLDLSSLPAGMYFLRVGENNNQLVKVIKE